MQNKASNSGLLINFILLAFFTVLSFEGLSLKLLAVFNLPIDIRFWSMGIGAASIFLSGWITVRLLCDLKLFTGIKYRLEIIAVIVLLLCYFLQAYRRTYCAPFWDDMSAVLEWLPGYFNTALISSQNGAQ